ncbi:MAG TPA: YqcC family protein [Spongiibacteraceae bacterium]|jgi:uncharacterized protein YqcC (DUF446 family)|nr:YqcC family protein [Spongiibacteraceae bacterium]HUH37546.1 YqcC family protein [Spongiibacteraceae bacterium]
MNDDHAALAALLAELEAALHHCDAWSCILPRADRLESELPFCVDTLSFPEWLQFVLLPRLGALVEGRLPLPTASGIEAMGTLYFAGDARADPLLQILKRLDDLLGGTARPQ